MTYPVSNIKSLVMFTDDCVLYRNIQTLQDCRILHEDLDSLALWEADRQMQFNLAKSDLALFIQTNSSQLHATVAKFRKRSVGKISCHNNHREHGLGSTYL